jgi:hypothetical protein
MSDNVFIVKLPDFPIFKKPIFSKGNSKEEELVSSVDLPKEENSKKLKTKYFLYIVYPLIFLGSLGLYLVFNNYFSGNELFKKSSPNQAQATPTPTPKPTIKPLPTGKQTYNYSHSSSVAGPKPTQIIIDPIDPKQGDAQILSVKIGNTTPISKANIVLKTDNQETEYPLVLTEKGVDFGIWTAKWEMNDSYDYTYQIEIVIYGTVETFTGALTFR